MVADRFVAEAARFREDLARAVDWRELRSLWARSIPPYRVAAADPLSDAYRLEIPSLYQRLTGLAYELENEMTSTKVSAADFERGYPWMTNDLGVAASEMAKTVQAFRVIQAHAPEAQRMIEFGVGWANLALALAQVGRDVTAVDIDAGFTARTEEMARRAQLGIRTVTADFLAAARGAAQDFDAVIFQSSFHHCLDFVELLSLVRTRVLAPGGRVFFFAEPVFPAYPFPWGLRTDGESLWAITVNKWCELGFDRDFFIEMLQDAGFFATSTGGIAGVIGDAWVATPAELGLPFAQLSLPSHHDATFHPAGEAEFGRFLRDHSVLSLPKGMQGGELTFANHALAPLSLRVRAGGGTDTHRVAPGTESTIRLADCTGEITFHSETFVPHEVHGNGDTRRVGLALKRIRLDRNAD